MSGALGRNFSLLPSIGKHHISYIECKVSCQSRLYNNEHIACNHAKILEGESAIFIAHTGTIFLFLSQFYSLMGALLLLV